MTVLEKVRQCVENLDCEKDTAEKLIALAYYIGKEEATREVSDSYKKLLKDQRSRAENCRYKHMAAKIIGDQKYIYFPDYAQDMTGLFGSDKTEV